MSGKRISEEERENIIQLLRGGHESNEIAQWTGVHPHSVYNIKCEINLTKTRSKYAHLNKKVVTAVLEDIKAIQDSRPMTTGDIKKLSLKHEVSETTIKIIRRLGLDAVSSRKRRVTPSKLQTIYKSLENGESLAGIAKKVGIAPSTVDYYKRRYARGKDIRTCAASDCDNTFIPRLDGKPREYCCDRCRDREKQKKYRVVRPKQGKCPQCGRKWVEPERTHRGKPQHCLNCQRYYRERYKMSRKD